jgi:hypothetical protein
MQTNVIIFMDRSAMMRQYPALTMRPPIILSPATIKMKGYTVFASSATKTQRTSWLARSVTISTVTLGKEELMRKIFDTSECSAIPLRYTCGLPMK